MPIGALALISAFFFMLHRKELAADEPSEILAVTAENFAVMETLTEQDTDRDGLKDWEETLWGSDPKRSDTDSDGTDDGREVELNRNPSAAGPDDDAHDPAFIATTHATSAASTTLTTAAVQEMYTGYILLKQTNSLTPESVQGLVSSVLDHQNYQPREKKYGLADLDVDESNSPETLLAYRIALEAMLAGLKAIPENEFTILQRLFANATKDDRDALLLVSQKYQAAAEQMRAMRVPIAIQTPHLTILNNLQQRSETVVRLATFSTDPLASMLELQSILPEVQANSEASQQISAYLSAQGV